MADPQYEDWTKFVTLNPPNEVKFHLAEEDKGKLASGASTEPIKA